MPSNVLTLGNSTKDNAMAGFRQLANLETNRERANANIAFQNDEMKKQETTSAIGSTLTGAAIGAQVAGHGVLLAVLFSAFCPQHYFRGNTWHPEI